MQAYKPGSVLQLLEALIIYLDLTSQWGSSSLPVPHKDEQPFTSEEVAEPIWPYNP
jgi:hypothetical protein